MVTGAAGFIGANLCLRLLKEYNGMQIVGVDNMNECYDVSIKEYRLKEIERAAAKSASYFHFIKASISDKEVVEVLFQIYRPDIVVNRAAQVGVRYSITNPDAYVDSNLDGFFNILEACRHSYDGDRLKDGYSGVDHPVSYMRRLKN